MDRRTFLTSCAGTLAAGATPSSAAGHDLREWADRLPSDGQTDCRPLFAQVLADLAAQHAEDGQLHVVEVPAGTYRFLGAVLTPPPGGGIGVRGAGMGATTFLTPPSTAWLGTPRFKVGEAPFRWSDLLFEDFTVDGSAQPLGSAYDSSLKGFSVSNARDVVVRRVRVRHTHASGFGFDVCDRLRFVECVALDCGRGRAAHTRLDRRIGSGSGFGIGFGNDRSEHVELVSCVGVGNGAAGVLGEKLARPAAEVHAAGLCVLGGVFEGNAIGIDDAGTGGSRFLGATLRGNTLAGLRIGTSYAYEQGGRGGIASALAIHGNAHGVIIDGSANAYDLHDLEVTENAGHGAWDGTPHDSTSTLTIPPSRPA